MAGITSISLWCSMQFFLAIGLVFLVLPFALNVPFGLALGIAALGMILLSLWDATVTDMMYALVEGKSVHLSAIKESFVRSCRLGIMLGGINALMIIALMVALPFYASQNALWGIFVSGLLFWVMILVLLVLQYVPAIFAREQSLSEGNSKDSKRSIASQRNVFVLALYLFVDNPGFRYFAPLEIVDICYFHCCGVSCARTCRCEPCVCYSSKIAHEEI